MQITTCKISAKSINNFQTPLGVLDYNQLELHDNTVASMDVQLHATNKQNKPIYSQDIGTLRFFREHWTCPGIPDHTQQLSHYLTKASINILLR